MKLSPAMKESLLFIKQCTGPGIKCGRPSHHANMVTHNALIRRGLIAEANDDFHTTTLTAMGEVAVRALVLDEARGATT
jgi:hypothetical protein